MPQPAPPSDAALVRLALIHGAIVAAPVLIVALVLRLWILAIPLAIVAGVVATAIRLRGIDERITLAVGARPLVADESPRLVGLAEAVAMAAGVAIPRLMVIESPSVNALTWGFDGTTRLAVTTGLLDIADPVGLEAVVGHQLGLAGTRSVAETTMAAALFGPFAKGALTPWVVSLIQGDDERSIVLADLDGTRATRYPPGLVQILDLVRTHPTALPSVPPALSALCFAAPHDDDDPFAVHPPIDDRIDLLREI